jgi:hypothetical protein
MTLTRMVRPVPPADGGAIRGVYLWAGSATVDLHAVKFPDIPIDVGAHLAAHEPDAAQDLAGRGLNWVFLSMNWGFPPEREARHWTEFERAAAHYGEAGFHVVGYVQASNCLAEGSYAERDWYALSPRGRRIPYFRNRLMTCWNHEDWIAEVEARAHRVVDAGADGVFFDNLWMGGTPWVLGGRVGGFAGCACTRCRAALREATGLLPPTRLDTDHRSRRYLDWRAAVVTRRLEGWAAAVRARRPGARVLANNCDIILRDTRALFGIDPVALAPAQDAILIENIAMPRWDPARRMLIANALPVRAAQALIPDRPILTVTYEHGIGLDGPPDPRRLRRAVAEAVALGASPVLKGSEYIGPDGRFTVLTAAAFRPLRDAVTDLLQWIAGHEALLAGAVRTPDVEVLYDETAFAWQWSPTASGTFALAQALLALGVPFAFATAASLAARADGGLVRPAARGAAASSAVPLPLLVPPGLNPPVGAGRVIHVPARALSLPDPGAATRAGRVVHRAADPLLRALSAGYFGSARIRRRVDRSGLTAAFLRSPFFRLPRDVTALAALLPPTHRPAVRSDAPLLVERRRSADGRCLLHLVNYADTPTAVELPERRGPRPALYSPDPGTRWCDGGSRLRLALDCYAILEETP